MSGSQMTRLGAGLGVAVALVLFSPIGMAQNGPNIKCPDGWETASATVDIGKIGGSVYQRKTISVDVPSSKEVMTISQPERHPKFCWKESASANWECHHSDPWQGAWARFDTFRPAQASPKGDDYRRYSVVFQNESHDRDRNGMLVICYR